MYPHPKIPDDGEVVAFTVKNRRGNRGEAFVDANYGESVIDHAKMSLDHAMTTFYVCQEMRCEGSRIYVETEAMKKTISLTPKRAIVMKKNSLRTARLY